MIGLDIERGFVWSKGVQKGEEKRREEKRREEKRREDKTRQDKTRQDKTRQDKTRQDNTRHDKTRQDKTTKDMGCISRYVSEWLGMLGSAPTRRGKVLRVRLRVRGFITSKYIHQSPS